MMLHGVKAGVRAALIIERIHGPSDIGERDQPDRGVQPKAFEIVGEQSSLGFGEGPVADPCEFATEDVPQLRPSLQPSACAGEFVVSDFLSARIAATELRMHGATGAKCGLSAEKDRKSVV